MQSDWNEYRPRILIVGDSILDVWHVVEKKESQEDAPCYTIKRTLTLPGGAANVARQLTNYNCDIRLVSPVDSDTSSKKIRYWDGTRVVLRVDDERAPRCVRGARLDEGIKEAFEALKEDPKYDVLVISDYGKGLLNVDTTRLLIEAAKFRNIPVLADPKLLPPRIYRDVSVLKVNRQYHEKYDRSHFAGHADNLVITYGKGDTVFRYEDIQNWVDIEAPLNQLEAICAVGAGDCFLAHLALAWGRGLQNVEAVKYADRAARNYVTRPFAEPLFPHESLGSKTLAAEDLAKVIKVRHKDETVVVSNGCFDLLHPGAIHTLQWAKGQGTRLIALVNNDQGVSRLKGKDRPRTPLTQRMQALEALACIDYVVSFEGTDPRPTLEILKPAILVKGYDYEGEEVLTLPNVEVRIAPKGEYGLHSTELIQNVAPAHAMSFANAYENFSD